jgi:apolipoprotein D and lipocalin family protein
MGAWFSATPSPPPTAPSVNLIKYTGGGKPEGKTWYCIFHLPQIYQPSMAINTTATYTLNLDHPEPRIKVVNRMMLPMPFSDEYHEVYIDGVAMVDKFYNNDFSKLLVSFRPNPTSPIVGPPNAPYWILMVDEVNYTYAVVSDPHRHTLWILSSTPTLDPAVATFIMRTLVDVHKFTLTQIDMLHKTVHTPLVAK